MACPCFPPCRVRTGGIELGQPPCDQEGLASQVKERLTLNQDSQPPPPPSNRLDH